MENGNTGNTFPLTKSAEAGPGLVSLTCGSHEVGPVTYPRWPPGSTHAEAGPGQSGCKVGLGKGGGPAGLVSISYLARARRRRAGARLRRGLPAAPATVQGAEDTGRFGTTRRLRSRVARSPGTSRSRRTGAMAEGSYVWRWAQGHSASGEGERAWGGSPE